MADKDEKLETGDSGVSSFDSYRRRCRAQILSAAATSTLGQSSADARGRAVYLQKLVEKCNEISNKDIIDSPTNLVDDTRMEEKQRMPVGDGHPQTYYNPEVTVGKTGTAVNIVSNFIKLYVEPNKGVYHYEVQFTPTVETVQQRIKYINEHRDKMGGTKTFDGITLYLPIQLPSKDVVYTSKSLSDDSSNVEIKIIFKKKELMKNCVQLYNILFDRVMKVLKYVRFQGKQFDPTAPMLIPQAKLEIWPGYVTAVDEFQGGVMLCCDVSHKLLCQESVLDILTQIRVSKSPDFQYDAKKALLGSVIITRYNNQTYRIDDIDFDNGPTSTVSTTRGEVSFVDYYRKNYNIEIRNQTQPLLVSIKKREKGGATVEQELKLVPELCYLTGLRDAQRADFKLMRELATFTRVSPNQRILALDKFYENINNNPDARKILADWGLKLNRGVEKFIGRVLPEEKINFANNTVSAGIVGDFNKHIGNNKALEAIPFTNWIIMHCKSDTKRANNFYENLMRSASAMGLRVFQPNMVPLDNDRTDTFVNNMRSIVKKDTQIVVVIFPTMREDRYAALKKVCCTELPIPTQMINSKTLGDERKIRSIVQKIALQMNCKLGGSLWSLNIPLKNAMICGIDSYHEVGSRGNSVSAFVASINGNFTKWYSKAIVQTRKEEIVCGLTAAFTAAIGVYLSERNDYPDSIIIYRDGVGDGNLALCSQFEVPQFFTAATKVYPGFKPRISFIVVQKRSNTRYFTQSNQMVENPTPGTIVDTHITRKSLYDFYMVPQTVRQGTVTPTHYVVLRDDCNYSPDIMQRLTYKLCYLYYNWPGSIRNPACCQYAHKLAYLVGKCIRMTPAEKLAKNLYYL